MYREDRCDLCGQCLASCRFLGFDPETAKTAMRELAQGAHPEWLTRCATCYSCVEACPNQADPFSLILRRMEEAGTYFPKEMVMAVHAHFSPKGEYNPPKLSGRVFSACTINAALAGSLEGRLFDGAEILKGRHVFCNILYTHMGNASLFEDAVEGVIQRLASTGAEEIVFLHDDCYTMIALAREKGVHIPFKAVHILEYLAGYLREHAGDIRPLGAPVAYQRPCASRYTPEKDVFLDEIFARTGVTRVAREYDRENALCCLQNTGDMLPARKELAAWRDKNIGDAVRHGARALVYLCPICREALGKKAEEAGLAQVMITDLARMALGEIPSVF
jgi:Fe-S oxidoreductase